MKYKVMKEGKFSPDKDLERATENAKDRAKRLQEAGIGKAADIVEEADLIDEADFDKYTDDLLAEMEKEAGQ